MNQNSGISTPSYGESPRIFSFHSPSVQESDRMSAADIQLQLPTKRYNAKAVTGNMLTIMDDIESNLVPPYLRDVNTWRTYAKTRAVVEYANVIRSNMEFLQKSRTKHWHVQNVDLNGWRENKIDKRMIYNSNENLFKQAEELQPTSRPNTPEQEVPRPNAELKVEKTYILDTKGRVRSPINMTAKRLMKQTMKEFNKPIEPPETPYCSPKDSMSIDIEEVSPRPIKYDTVTNFPMGVARWARRHEGTICTHNGANSLGQYCDVLGPYVCKKCIEITNRRIIAEIQKESFPELEFSITNIVAPRLSRSMIRGERLMSRERSTGITRSHSDVGSKAGILKFPSVTKIDPKEFKRPGIEGKWHERAKTYHYNYHSNDGDGQNTEEQKRRIKSSKISSAKSQKDTAGKLKRKGVRTVSISPVKTIVY